MQNQQLTHSFNVFGVTLIYRIDLQLSKSWDLIQSVLKKKLSKTEKKAVHHWGYQEAKFYSTPYTETGCIALFSKK